MASGIYKIEHVASVAVLLTGAFYGYNADMTIVSHAVTDDYRAGWERVFGKNAANR